MHYGWTIVIISPIIRNCATVVHSGMKIYNPQLKFIISKLFTKSTFLHQQFLMLMDLRQVDLACSFHASVDGRKTRFCEEHVAPNLRAPRYQKGTGSLLSAAI